MTTISTMLITTEITNKTINATFSSSVDPGTIACSATTIIYQQINNNCGENYTLRLYYYSCWVRNTIITAK